MNDITSKPEAASAAAQDKALQEFLGAPPTSKWSGRRKWIILAVVLVVAALLAWRLWGGKETTSYATAAVEQGNLTVSVSATGNLAPTNQVEVGSEQSGLVTDVYVDNNDRVTKGQPLARLDTSRLRDTITQNQASVAAAQASVAQAQATAVNARASLDRLEEVYRLSAGKVPSKSELDSARAENLRAVAGVRSAQAQVTQQRATLSSSLTNLSKATIFSPVNGVVLVRQIDPGQTVAASFNAPVLFTIAEDLSKMKLEVKVDEADVGQVKEGQRATFTVDAYPGRTFQAFIKRVDVGSSSTSTSGSTSSANTIISYTAELSVENPDFSLRPGMTATADIVTMAKCDVILVPNAALRFNPATPVAQSPTMMPGMSMGGPMRGAMRQRPARQVGIGRGSKQTVYVLGANGEPQPVQVTVGETNGAVTEVIGGLKAGQEVITSRLTPEALKAGAAKGGPAGKQDGRRGASGGGFGGQGRDRARCVETGNGPPQGQAVPGGAPGAAPGQAPRAQAGPGGRPTGMGPQGAARGEGRRNFDPNDPRAKAWMERRAAQGGGQGGVQRQPGE